MCERSADCSKNDACQLVIRNNDTGIETVEYYCKAHLVGRICEVEAEDGLAVVDATKLWS
ncbi:hypothetical protein EL22_10970 [Halostagnicola sp. A56]|uniref:hypothetical protein n=1 Tax=Halostagnicola sp. A56 TaxID=1495067 RepID=UPI0004A05BD6|nr:hypothetical protein [Halostagnicola sp. A56]KDE60097.1 hypothetical protein EL22_10970 [Halostagnicola sp. A56]